MSTLGLMLTLFMTLVFTSCQVKDSSSDNGLYSGHAPTTNKFTLQTPATKTYVEGETITLVASFPFDIVADTTGGSPRLRLTVGATTRYATAVASADPTKLVFEYTFVAGENDTNGIDVTALQLNGSILQFDKDGVMTNCNVASVTTKNFSGVKVDTAGPTVTAFNLTNLPSATPLGTGKKLNFTMTFSEKVYLAGTTPEFDISFDTGTGTAVYTTGSGTTTLYFEYTITSTVNDANGYNDFSALDIGAGTIKDAVGNDANLTFTALEAAVRTYSAGVIVGGQYPAVVATTFPANKTYVVAEDLDFVFEFDRDINVTGTPYLDITVSGATPSARQAQYVPEPGPTRFVTFRYTTVPGDVDADGITVASSINNDSNTAFIRDDSAPNNNFLTAGYNTYDVPTTTGIILNALQPQAISVARNIDITQALWGTPTDNVWNIGQILNITVGFNTPVFVDQTLGTPSLPITIGGTTVQAPYLSGSGQANLIFKYTIQEGDLDTDGTLDIGTLQLNNGNIVDAQSTNILLTMPVTGITNTRVDGVRPTLTNVTPPTDEVYSNVTTYSPQFTRSELVFSANWSEAVHYSANGTITMTVNGASRDLVSYNNDSAVITHRPTATFPANIESGIVVTGSSITGATITDQAGNTTAATTFAAPDVSGISVDTLPPTVSTITPISSSGTYKAAETIDFSVTFSESVTIARNATYPRIRMTVGATTRYMIATTNGSGTTHTYRHTVTSPDVDTNGVNSVNVHENNGTTLYARDAGRNPATVAINQNFAGYNVDAQVPTVTGASRTTNGTYETGDVLEVSVTYSEAVTVDDSGGTPSVNVTIGSNSRSFDYDSTVGNTLYFRYTLASDDFDPNGLPTTINTISLNGGTIMDVGENNAPTSFAGFPQNMSQIFAMFPNTSIWFQTGATNKAKTPATATYAGVVGALDSCGAASNCRRFDGDDSLSVNVNNVETLFIAFKTPATEADHNIFGPDVTLEENGINFDFQVNGASSILLNGATVGVQTAVTVNTTYVAQIDYVSETFSGTMIDTTFDGSLGEVIVVTGPLTGTQKDTIRNYLLGRFP